MKTVIVNGKPWKTEANRASYENVAFLAGFDPEADGITITYRAKVKMKIEGSGKVESGSYEGIMRKGSECLVVDGMVINVGRF